VIALYAFLLTSPSGYVLWETELGGLVPCFSTLQSYLTPPAHVATTNNAGPAIVTSTIVNVIYARNYPVAKSGLSTGAKAGVGVGVGFVGLALLGGLGWFFLRRWKKKERTDYPSAQPPAEMHYTPGPFQVH
jgi:hypothetical protein